MMSARILTPNRIRLVVSTGWELSLQTLGLIVLLLAVLTSACAVIYLKALQRELYDELQVSQQLTDRLRIKRGQLLLEQHTWSAPARVQRLAQQQLGMVVPKTQDIMIVSWPH